MTQTQPSAEATEVQLEQHRRELTGYCYRMLGSSFDAEDAVQDTMVRAWKAIDRFDGRSSLRSWLYRIATNVCFDMLGSSKRRAFPVDMSPTASPPVHASLGPQLVAGSWVEPIDENCPITLRAPTARHDRRRAADRGPVEDDGPVRRIRSVYVE